MKKHHYWPMLLSAIFILVALSMAFAGGKPEITSHTVQYLDKALSVNVQWQSENPVTKVKVVAGRGEKELNIDEYDNRRNPSGYEGEVSVVIPMEPNTLQSTVAYQIQLEDDLRLKSTLFTGQTTPPPGTVIGGVMGVPGNVGVGVGVGIGVGIGGAPGVGIGVGSGMVGTNMAVQPVTNDDGWGKDHIRAGKGQGETHDGKSNDMVDKLLKVAERFDTPPALDVIKVNVLGPENVTFSSKANDDKGIRDITFRVYDGQGNKAGEQILTNLGKKWEGSTQPIKLTNGGNYRVVAQAVDSAGNTSKEQVATFTVKGTPPPTTLVVTLAPQEAVSNGALWQLDGGEWQQSAASISSTPGKHKLLFKDATGWVSPVPQDFDIKEGANTATGTYTIPAPKEGKLSVTLLPPDAVRSGAQWQADGGAWQTSGASITLKQGKHTLTFKDVSGWISPQSQDIEIKDGVNSASGTYTVIPPKTGKLVVSILPSPSVVAGAQWQADGGTWQAGDSAATLAIGQHTISFKDITGWITPSPQKIEIKEGDNNSTGTYVQKKGSLTVTLLPADIGNTAQWSVDGGALQKSGTSATLPLGSHTLKFSDAQGWTTPPQQTVDIKEGVNSATGTYTAQNGTLVVTIVPTAAVAAGAQWRVGAGAWQNSGTSLSVPGGNITVEFKELAGWVKPANISAVIVSSKTTTTGAGYGKIFTTNADFESGQLVGLEDQTVKDQLQLSKKSTTLPFIWVPNSDEGTISKINTETGVELGRYRVGPPHSDPSRTTVDLMGNCWVATRGVSTAVKIGLAENGQCIDRNGNGKIETSNNSTPLAWGEDECALFEVSIQSGATYIPGKNSNDYSGAHGPRGVAIDANNNVWVSTFYTNKMVKIDGTSGKVIEVIDFSPYGGHPSYGLVVDKQGKVWSSGHDARHVLRYNPQDKTVIKIPTKHMVYGIGIDRNGHLFAAGLGYGRMTRINTVSEQIDIDGVFVGKNPRSIAVTTDGDVWVTNWQYGSVTRYSNDLKEKATIQSSGELAGVAVDSNGKVWAVDYYNRLIRINADTNTVEKDVPVRGFHYSYSDMTGFVSRTMTTQIGTWTVLLDSKGDQTAWHKVGWNSNIPQNTAVKVRVRSSKDQANWSSWEDVGKDMELKTTPVGRFVQAEVTLQVITGDVSPTLADLTLYAK